MKVLLLVLYFHIFFLIRDDNIKLNYWFLRTFEIVYSFYEEHQERPNNGVLLVVKLDPAASIAFECFTFTGAHSLYAKALESSHFANKRTVIWSSLGSMFEKRNSITQNMVILINVQKSLSSILYCFIFPMSVSA